MSMVAIKSLGVEDTEHHLKLGYTVFELQLCEDILELGADFYCQQFRGFAELYDLNVVAIHTPLIEGEALEVLGLNKRKEAFYESCKVAEHFALNQGTTVNVVIHTGVDANQVKQHFFDNSLKLITNALNLYPNINILIENTINLSIFEDGTTHFRLGTDSNFHDVARYISKILSTNRVGSLLDICHAQCSMNVIKAIYDARPEKDEVYTETLEAYFKKGVGICKHIHLAQAIGYGEGRLKKHGLGFAKESPEDINLLKQIIAFKHQYLEDVLVVVEVTEDDYSNSPKQFETYQMYLDLEQEYLENHKESQIALSWQMQ